jgi:diaminohydroxyphosphoribosylaminopyrimidine deaminase/5-amino-6-(5-phosphoribosylamino)uracil reductase
MSIALDAARGVRGYTSPNPWVGSVVTRDARIVSTGATAPPGGPHAEAAALAGIDARGATLWVTLEPCAPFPGKRTRPCAEVIVEAGVSKVVIALEDPDPNIRGRGIAILRDAGIHVETGDGHAQALDLLRPYLKHREIGMPYVIAKYAASLDGRIAAASGESKWITGGRARERVHAERAWVDAVLVGTGTALADDPSLTARPGGVETVRQPIRIVVDAHGRLPAAAKLLHAPGHAIIATTAAADAAWKRAITATGATIIECEPAETGVNLHQLLRTLARRGIMSIWAEGGGSLTGSLFEGGHVDEVWAFIAPIILGSDSIPAVSGFTARHMAEALRLRDVVIEPLHPDMLIRGYTGAWSP